MSYNPDDAVLLYKEETLKAINEGINDIKISIEQGSDKFTELAKIYQQNNPTSKNSLPTPKQFIDVSINTTANQANSTLPPDLNVYQPTGGLRAATTYGGGAVIASTTYKSPTLKRDFNINPVGSLYADYPTFFFFRQNIFTIRKNTTASGNVQYYLEGNKNTIYDGIRYTQRNSRNPNQCESFNTKTGVRKQVISSLNKNAKSIGGTKGILFSLIQSGNEPIEFTGEGLIISYIDKSSGIRISRNVTENKFLIDESYFKGPQPEYANFYILNEISLGNTKPVNLYSTNIQAVNTTISSNINGLDQQRLKDEENLQRTSGFQFLQSEIYSQWFQGGYNEKFKSVIDYESYLKNRVNVNGEVWDPFQKCWVHDPTWRDVLKQGIEDFLDIVTIAGEALVFSGVGSQLGTAVLGAVKVSKTILAALEAYEKYEKIINEGGDPNEIELVGNLIIFGIIGNLKSLDKIKSKIIPELGLKKKFLTSAEKQLLANNKYAEILGYKIINNPNGTIGNNIITSLKYAAGKKADKIIEGKVVEETYNTVFSELDKSFAQEITNNKDKIIQELQQEVSKPGFDKKIQKLAANYKNGIDPIIIKSTTDANGNITASQISSNI